MKINKTTILISVVTYILLNFSNAYSGYLDNCVVYRTGIAPAFENSVLTRSSYVVWIQHSSWTGSRVFFLSSEAGDAALAVLLSAISTSKTVSLEIGGSTTASNTAGSIITRAYLNSY